MSDQNPLPVNKPQTNWFVVLFTSLYIVGIILISAATFISIERPTTLLIVAYSVMGITLGLVATKLYVKMNSNLNNMEAATIYNWATNFITYLGPIFLLIVIVSLLLYLYITYKKNIDDRRVSNQFFVFNSISTVLMLLEYSILFYGLNTDEFKKASQFPKIINAVYLFGVIQLYAVFIMWYILSSYTTDGFSLLNKKYMALPHTLIPVD